MKPECRNCFWARMQPVQDSSLQRVCTRYPPQLVTLQATGTDPVGRPVLSVQIMSMFPAVKDDQGCGEYKPVLTSVQ